MKRIALLSLVLVFGLVFVQPLQADIIGYTIQADFYAPTSSAGDPFGIGSGMGTAIFNFTLTPPPDSIDDSYFRRIIATYTAGSPNVTLSGTSNADGIYSPSYVYASFVNWFNAPSVDSDVGNIVMRTQVSGTEYEFSLQILFDLSFWSEGEVPLPKLVSQGDVIDIFGDISDSGGSNSYYYLHNGTLATQVVPLPGGLVLLGSGLLGLGAVGWRRRRKG